MTDDNEFIDLRDQLAAYVDEENFKYIKITLLSGDNYVVTRKADILILARVVFVFQGAGTESCFLFDAVCNVDVICQREI